FLRRWLMPPCGRLWSELLDPFEGARRQASPLLFLNAPGDAPAQVGLVSRPGGHAEQIAVLLGELTDRERVQRCKLPLGVGEGGVLGALREGVSIRHVTVSLRQRGIAAGGAHGGSVLRTRQVNSALVRDGACCVQARPAALACPGIVRARKEAGRRRWQGA